MRNLIVFIVVFAFASVADAQPQQTPTPLQAPPVDLSAALTYAQGVQQSILTSKDLVVFVGIPDRPGRYELSCEASSLPGYPEKCIILCTPWKGKLVWVMTWDAEGSPLKQKEVSRPGSPFPRSSIDSTVEACVT